MLNGAPNRDMALVPGTLTFTAQQIHVTDYECMGRSAP